MQRKSLKAFFQNHPKLFELAFAGTAAVGTIVANPDAVAATAGP